MSCHLTKANFRLLWLFCAKNMSIEIKLRKGEPMDRAIRRLKKTLDREGTIRDVRAKRYFEKPSDKKRKARELAAFNQMLRTRYEKM